MAYDLTAQPWIHAVSLTGERRMISLSEAFSEAHKLRAVHGDNPLETVAILRLLLAILHRSVSGPRSIDEWIDIWSRDAFDSRPQTYLTKQRGSFNLMGDRPFFQNPTLNPDKATTITKLQLDRSAGNNSTLLDPSFDDKPVPVPISKAARILLAFNLFAPGYTVFKDAPACRGYLFYLNGSSLFETLMLNLVEYQPSDEDIPAWEIPFEDNVPARPTRGYLDVLTLISRQMMLIPEIINGEVMVKYAVFSPGQNIDCFEPMKAYRAVTMGQEVKILPVRPKRLKSWHDIAATLATSLSENSSPLLPQTPVSIHWVKRLAAAGILEKSLVLRLTACGLVTNQARMDALIEESVPLNRLCLDDDQSFFSMITDCLVFAERRILAANFFLRKIVTAYYGLSGKDGARKAREMTESFNLEDSFWSALSVPFERLMTGQLSAEDWQSIVVQVRYNQVCEIKDRFNNSKGIRSMVVSFNDNQEQETEAASEPEQAEAA